MSARDAGRAGGCALGHAFVLAGLLTLGAPNAHARAAVHQVFAAAGVSVAPGAPAPVSLLVGGRADVVFYEGGAPSLGGGTDLRFAGVRHLAASLYATAGGELYRDYGGSSETYLPGFGFAGELGVTLDPRALPCLHLGAGLHFRELSLRWFVARPLRAPPPLPLPEGGDLAAWHGRAGQGALSLEARVGLLRLTDPPAY